MAECLSINPWKKRVCSHTFRQCSLKSNKYNQESLMHSTVIDMYLVFEDEIILMNRKNRRKWVYTGFSYQFPSYISNLFWFHSMKRIRKKKRKIQ